MLPFFIGLGVGAISSAIGALFSYWFGLRNNTDRSAAPLVYLFLTVFLLGLIGAVALIVGLLSGGIMQALVCGLGVVIGFSLVFALSLFGYLKLGDTA